MEFVKTQAYQQATCRSSGFQFPYSVAQHNPLHSNRIQGCNPHMNSLALRNSLAAGGHFHSFHVLFSRRRWIPTESSSSTVGSHASCSKGWAACWAPLSAAAAHTCTLRCRQLQ